MLRELDPIGGGREALREDYIDQLFREVSESLDLTPTQHAEAAKSYQCVGEWLDAPDSPLRRFRPLVCPQGSFALGTTTKPLGRDDFDLDATCVVDVPPEITPAELKRLIGGRLRAHAVYRDLLEEKSRCWRLNYARDFHLDIIPSKPKFPQSNLTSIYITDKELRAWLESNPKGYIAWFKIRKVVQAALFANRAPSANVEPAPKQESSKQKSPLQIAIQLLKRHRDVMFQGREDAPISIIITTLAGHAYQQEDSIIAALRGLIKNMPAFIDRSKGYPCVANPTNAAENFADKWRAHPEREEAFYKWNEKASRDVDALSEATGFSDLRAALARFLGTKRTDIVLNRMAEKTNEARVGGGLKVDTRTGIVGASAGIIVPRGNFYGDSAIGF
jgi:hypothetical protein